MGKRVEIREPMISANKLYERWTGIHGHEEELARLIDASGDPFRANDIPIAYVVHKVLDAGKDGIISICSECIPTKGEKYYSPYHTNYHGSECYYDFEGIAFLKSQIVEYEKRNRELFYRVIENYDEIWDRANPDKGNGVLHPGLATLSAYEIINRFKITPIELVDILNGVSVYDDHNEYITTKRLVTTDEGNFRAHTFSEPYFTENDIENVKIYQLDFDRYCKEWGIQERT